jgi:integrase
MLLGHRQRGGEYTALTELGIYQVVKDACRRAWIAKPVCPHLLRHSWMTEMLRQGMNPIELSFTGGVTRCDCAALCAPHQG